MSAKRYTVAEIGDVLVDWHAEYCRDLVDRDYDALFAKEIGAGVARDQVISELAYFKWFTIDFVVHSLGNTAPSHHQIMHAMAMRYVERGGSRANLLAIDERLSLYAEAVNEAGWSPEMLAALGGRFARLCGDEGNPGLQAACAAAFGATHNALLPFLKQILGAT